MAPFGVGATCIGIQEEEKNALSRSEAILSYVLL